MRSGQTFVLLLFAIAGTASAQVASTPSTPAASGSAAALASVDASGPAEAWSAKPVGKYRVTLAMPSHDLTADVTIREENDKLIANIWPVGDNDGRDFGAAVMGSRLVISGPTERGALNLTLEHRGSNISGTWQLGDQKGAVTGAIGK
jgi:hypothetical protein